MSANFSKILTYIESNEEPKKEKLTAIGMLEVEQSSHAANWPSPAEEP